MSEVETVFGEVLLTDCKEVRKVLPAASGVKVRIDKATVKDNSFDGAAPSKEYLNLQLRIVDGISFVDENGEAQTKYKNMVVFTDKGDLDVWADLNHEWNKKDSYVKGSYLVPLRKFLVEAGQDVSKLTSLTVRDFVKELCASEALKGLELEVNIGQVQKKNKVTAEDGSVTWVPSGEFKNTFKNWKKA